MAQSNGNHSNSRFWLITSARTASNMLVKMLNLDAQGVRPSYHGGYFFMQAMFKRLELMTKPPSAWTEQERTELYQVEQDCFNKLQDYIAASEENDQVIFVKEHALLMNSPELESQYYHNEELSLEKAGLLVQRGNDAPTRSALNLTSMPDEFLKTWKPTFLIRHPAMQLPSLYRTTIQDGADEAFPRPTKYKEPSSVEATLKWFRTLYEFYAVHFGENNQWPIILDADDLMKNPSLVAEYAKVAGLNPEKVIFSWDKASTEKVEALSAAEKIMLSSINASTKVDHSKLAGNIDIDAESTKWKAEFGEELGEMLEKVVRDAMPDYEYLWAKRMTL